MTAGVTVTALADSVFLNTSLKAFKVQAGETVTVYDLEYARRLVALDVAAFPAGAADWPQVVAEASVEVEATTDAVVEPEPVVRPSKKGRAASK